MLLQLHNSFVPWDALSLSLGQKGMMETSLNAVWFNMKIYK